MHVIINGKQIEIAVSEGGMFYDSATKTVSATSLKGLTKKLREQAIPSGGIRVERDNQQGSVTGRVKSRGWRSQYVIVKWDNGETAEVSNNSFIRPLTPDERSKLAELKAVVQKHKDERNEKETKLSAARKKEADYLATFSLTQMIDEAFPEKE